MRVIHLYSPDRGSSCSHKDCCGAAIVLLHIIQPGVAPHSVRCCNAHFLEFAADVETWELFALRPQPQEGTPAGSSAGT